MKKIHVEKTTSRGIVAAPVYLYKDIDLTPDQNKIEPEQIEPEKQRFQSSKDKVIEELRELAAENEIFGAHLEIAEDFTLVEGVLGKISERNNAEEAVSKTIGELEAIFSAIDDAYMKERAADIRDIGKRYLAKLKGVTLPDLGNIDREVVVVAKDLFPSDTVKLNPEYVRGIITEEGGVTSHVSILANNMRIPILVGVKGIMSELAENKDLYICMDAGAGEIVIGPTEEELNICQEKKVQYEESIRQIETLREKEPVTKDGKRIRLCVNAGNPEDVKNALPMKIDGVGLFRSELVYMEKNHFPTEEEQFEIYKEAVKLSPEELTIRTLDIGGDKDLPYFQFEEEDNPFLGWRAIRICLEKRDMFKAQIRAILRASAFGNVRIMFPMIVSPEELRQAKETVEECKKELRQEEKAFDEQIETGMMIETPASVLLAGEFAKEADFFSIGTNDLTQYLLAVDRGNKKIAAMYDFFHPAVLRAVETIIKAGHKEGIMVGMCGEMAGDPKAVPLLLKMGLDEFSVSAANLDYVRKIILAGR